jgi:anti-anti-sigma factor
MATKPLEAQVRQKSGLAVVELRGEIDSLGEAALNAAYQEAIRTDPRTVLLNFAEVDYINSTGIALIVGVLAEARKSGRRLLTCGLSPHYREIFEITRLSHFMSVFPDEGAALASINAN